MRQRRSKTRNEASNKASAFTLLELLVVIAIIGVLITVLLPNFMGFRSRGSDAKKKSELKQVKAALQMFYNDFHYYPATGEAGGESGDKLCCSADGATAICSSVCTDSFAVGNVVYMKELPEDYNYNRLSVDSFLLTISLENSADQDLSASADKCNIASPVASVYYLCED